MASSHLLLRAVLLLLAGLLHTEVAISADAIQESSAVSHQGNINSQPKEDGSSDALQQNENGDLQCRLPFMDIGGRCLMLETFIKGPWSEMKLFCQQLGGQMLKMDDCGLLYYIAQFIKDEGLSDHNYWIGCSDSKREGHFVHLDGTPMMMGTPFWGFNPGSNIQEPNGGTTQNCVVIDHAFAYDLNDIDCNAAHNVICQQVD